MRRSFEQRVGARRDQRGIALIFCLFALILLSSIAFGLIYMSDTESVINRNFRSSQQAYLAANAGLEATRARLSPDITDIDVTTLPMPGGAGSVIYIINQKLVGSVLDAIDPLDPANPYYDTELCHENYPPVNASFAAVAADANPGFNIPCAPVAPAPVGPQWWTYLGSKAPKSKSPAALNFKWVRVNLKENATDAHGGTKLLANGGFYVDGGNDSTTYATQVCWDGTRELLLPPGYGVPGNPGAQGCDKPPASAGVIYSPVVVLTAYGQGSHRITQMQVAQNPPIITNAAVDSQDFVTLNGKLGVNGYDYCSCQAVKDAKGNVIGYTNLPGKTCDASKWAIYSANTVDTPGPSEAIVSGQSPPYVQNQQWPYDIPSMVQSYTNALGTVDVTKSAAYNWTCPGTPPDCGTRTGAVFGVPPTFPPSPPDNPVGPADMAAQYTYIPGTVHLTGGAKGNGVLIVDGDLEINGGLQFYGLILVSGVVTFTGGGSDPTNIYGAVLAGQSSIDNTTLGGSANIVYDVCSLKNGRKPQPPSLLSFRELNY